MSVGALGVLVARAVLAACAALALPWLHGEVNYASLEPNVDSSAHTLPRVAHMRTRSESRAHEYVQAVRRQLSLSSALFCVAFEESTMLFVLVFLEHVHGDMPWIHTNWHASLPLVLLLIVLGLRTYGVTHTALTSCFLLCFAGGYKTRWHTSRAVATTVLFVLWCWAFLRMPLPQSVVAAASGFMGFVLARAGMLGITLIAALSGSAAGGAICDSYEAIAIRRSRRWRDTDLQSAQDSFERACFDLHTAKKTAADLTEEIARAAPQSSWRFWARSAKDRELAALQTEIIGLEAMANTMRSDLEMMREHERRMRYQRTPLGRVLLLSSHVFSVYCAVRVVQCVLNLALFGYGGSSSDVVSTCLVYAMRLLGIDLDVALWAPRIGFLAVGGLIVLRMRVLLSTLSMLIRSVSTGISAQLLVLFTAEVLCIYTLAALIQLHASVGTTRTHPSALLAVLPEFQRVFGALFDGVFLVAALLTGAYRWFQWQSDAFAAFDS